MIRLLLSALQLNCRIGLCSAANQIIFHSWWLQTFPRIFASIIIVTMWALPQYSARQPAFPECTAAFYPLADFVTITMLVVCAAGMDLRCPGAAARYNDHQRLLLALRSVLEDADQSGSSGRAGTGDDSCKPQSRSSTPLLRI